MSTEIHPLDILKHNFGYLKSDLWTKRTTQSFVNMRREGRRRAYNLTYYTAFGQEGGWVMALELLLGMIQVAEVSTMLEISFIGQMEKMCPDCTWLFFFAKPFGSPPRQT